MGQKRAFTLVEVIVSIVLLGFILAVLYKSLDMVRFSNKHLYNHLTNSSTHVKAANTLYLDILKSDGNLTIQNKEDFSRLCINSTQNSLYNLAFAKVCWVVSKEDHRLLRIEGNKYKLPASFDEPLEVDSIIKDMTKFHIDRNGDNVLVMLATKKLEPISFLVQGIKPPPPPKKKKKVNNKNVKKTSSNVNEEPKDNMF
ncbi:MAG: type II secretion system protein [Campylobacterota bacterium]|nr:type II secretion system protein [Campylobacterota bacterium]